MNAVFSSVLILILSMAAIWIILFGTAGAAIHLVEKLGARVLKVLFVLELTGLGGRDRLAPTEFSSLMTFPA